MKGIAMQLRKATYAGLATSLLIGGIGFVANPAHAATGDPQHPCRAAARALKSDWTAFDVAAQGGMPDGIVSLDDMRRIARLGVRDSRKAAKFFISHPIEFKHLDTAAKHDSPDTKVSRADLSAFMTSWPSDCT
jgi:hypothetical protein